MENKFYCAWIEKQDCIWGLGHTEEEALADALKWANQNVDVTVTEDIIIVKPCTEELYEHVEGGGANCAWDVDDGVAYLVKEESEMGVEAKAKMTGEAQDFISKKIKILIDEGYEQEQATAIAYDMARKEGYDIPEKKEGSMEDRIMRLAEKGPNFCIKCGSKISKGVICGDCNGELSFKKQARDLPVEIDFSDMSSDTVFVYGKDTEVYKLLNDLFGTEKSWREYTMNLAYLGVSVEYDEIDDVYVVYGSDYENKYEAMKKKSGKKQAQMEYHEEELLDGYKLVAQVNPEGMWGIYLVPETDKFPVTTLAMVKAEEDAMVALDKAYDDLKSYVFDPMTEKNAEELRGYLKELKQKLVG